MGDNGQPASDAVREVEGRYSTRLLYLAPRERNSLEVFRNDERDLAAKGFAVHYKCSGEEEGEFKYGAGLHQRFSTRQTAALQNNNLSKVAFNVPADPRYLAATLSRPEGQVTVSLYVAVQRDGLSRSQGPRRRPAQVVERKPMEAKMVTADAATMAKDIAATGRVALYGLYFDTDKAELKPESSPSLAEIGKLLKAQPDLKVYIVGHTDNAGACDYTMGRSQCRRCPIRRTSCDDKRMI